MIFFKAIKNILVVDYIWSKNYPALFQAKIFKFYLFSAKFQKEILSMLFNLKESINWTKLTYFIKSLINNFCGKVKWAVLDLNDTDFWNLLRGFSV